MNHAKLTEEVLGVVRAHIDPLGFTVTVKPYTDGLVIEVSGHGQHHLEYLSLKGMPEPVQGEYVHCRAHALAAMLIASRYPT